MLIGNIGSGKSTWATKQIESEKDTVIVCKDAFRTCINNKYIFDPLQEPVIHHLTVTAIVQFLLHGFSVICDETNIYKQGRMSILKEIKKHVKKVTIVYVYFFDHGNNIEWRMRDSRGIGREVWERVYNNKKTRIQEPTQDEGYDVLLTIDNNNERDNNV